MAKYRMISARADECISMLDYSKLSDVKEYIERLIEQYGEDAYMEIEAHGYDCYPELVIQYQRQPRIAGEKRLFHRLVVPQLL